MADPAPEAYRLRVRLVGGPRVDRLGRLTIESGRLERLQVLDGDPAKQPFAVLSAGVVEIRQQAGQPQAAFDVTVSAGVEKPLGESIVRLELTGGEGSQPGVFEATVGELTRGRYERRLGAEGASVLIHRADADRVRVRTPVGSLILSPGELLPLEITAALPELPPASPLDISIALHRGRRGEAIWSSGSSRVESPVSGFAAASFSAPMPVEEGVYTVHVAVARPRGAVKAWLPGSTGTRLAERRFQVVVFDPAKPVAIPTAWRTLREIDPTNKHWWDRLPDWVWLRRAPWLPKGPLGNAEPTIVSRAGDQVLELPPVAAATPWQAYPIPVPVAGQPYVVEVDYPADAAQRLVLTVMDQDRFGAAGPLGASAGVVVSQWGGDQRPMRTARRVFWPSTKSPLLVISNGSADRPARYGRIRVRGADASAAAMRPAHANGRPLLLQVNAHDLPATVGASYGGAPEHEDWQTFRETAARLADYVMLAGHNGAVLTAASEHGALFPSRAAPDSLGLDREPVVTGVADLPGKDLLELLYREFDRRGLRLVARFELGPAAAARAAKELRDRYASHPSFGGLAIDLAALAADLPRGEGPLSPAVSTLCAIAEAVSAPDAATTDGGSDARPGAGPSVLVLGDRYLAEATRRQPPRLDGAPPVAWLNELRELLETDPKLELCVPRFAVGFEPLLNEAAGVLANNVAGPKSGVYAAPDRVRLADFEAASPFGVEQTSGLLTIAPTGDATLGTLAWVRGNGFRGTVLEGWGAPPLMLDERAIRLRAGMQSAEPIGQPVRVVAQQPVTVRAIQSPSVTTLEVTNTSPWAADAAITIRTPAGCAMAQPSQPGKPPTRYGRGEHVLQIAAAPFSAQRLRFDQPGVEPVGVRTRVGSEARADLSRVLADLRGRDLNARSRFELGPSPSFEAIGPDGRVADWGAIATPGAGAVTITTDSPADGKQAVRLASNGPAVGVQSLAFPMPATGQLAVVFSVRSIDLAGDSRLEVAFEQPGGGYRSYTLMGSRQLADARGDWLPYVLSVDDLPLARDGRLRIKFALTGGGRLDIDNLQLYDLVFPLDFLGGESAKQRLALLKTIHAAETALEAGRIVDCHRLLEGYWPRFVRAYTPLRAGVAASDGKRTQEAVAAKAPVAAPPAAGQDQPADGADEPGFSDRLRGYLPSFLRF
ncbi:MAG: hypothetical protein AAGB00_08360 [Planctomycetota bacterium]